MEAHHQTNQNPQLQLQEEMGNNGGKISASSYLCRQSSTRWTPTTEQIKILKELYYINGVRSPTADQIQNICSRLRRYGKIEGKNVFYWFQNHKARERQKKRLTPPNIISNLAPTQYQWKQDQEVSTAVQTTKYNNNNTINNVYPPPPGSVASASSSGQMMASFAYGTVTMENKFRDCSISGGNGLINGVHVNPNFQWGGAVGNYNPYAPPPNPPPYTDFLGKISAVDDDHHDNYQYYDDGAPEIETLPLFPVLNEDHHHHDHQFENIKPSGSDGYYYTGGYRWANGGGNGSATTSLELSLKINL